MKGFTFYQEFKDKSKRKSAGNVVACYGDIFRSAGAYQREAIGGVYHHPNSAVAGTSVTLDYLTEQCKRISEEKARKIHPALFARLDIESNPPKRRRRR